MSYILLSYSQRHGTHGLVNMYLPDAVLSWNGNAKKGKHEIADLLGNLPMSTSNVYSVDAQPINEKVLYLS